MNLGKRKQFILKKANICFLGNLNPLFLDKVKNLKGIGPDTFKTIKTNIESLNHINLNLCLSFVKGEDSSLAFQELSLNDFELKPKTKKILANNKINSLIWFLDCPDENILKISDYDSVYQHELFAIKSFLYNCKINWDSLKKVNQLLTKPVKEILISYFLKKYFKNRFVKLDKNQIFNILPAELRETSVVNVVLEKLVTHKILHFSKSIFMKWLPWLNDFSQQLKGKELAFWEKCLNGYSMAEIGRKFKLTRSRVQQVIASVLSQRPELYEDTFIDCFSKYNFSEQEFCEIFKQPKSTYFYLNLISSKGKKEYIK